MAQHPLVHFTYIYIYIAMLVSKHFIEISDHELENRQLMMLQVVIYYIVTVILTKQLVIATDNCTEYQFKTPYSYVGESCEDIYNQEVTSGQDTTPLYTRFIVE